MIRLVRDIGAEDNFRGNPNGPVTLVEYGDYECRYCARANRVVDELLRSADGDLVYVYRHFTLMQLHPHSMLAAQAAEAAGAQGRYWEMHHVLFENQDALEIENLIDYARLTAVDVGRFAEELEAETYLPKVRRDFMEGIRSGVNGTPTFFINGLRRDGAWDLASLRAAIDEAAGWHERPRA